MSSVFPNVTAPALKIPASIQAFFYLSLSFSIDLVDLSFSVYPELRSAFPENCPSRNSLISSLSSFQSAASALSPDLLHSDHLFPNLTSSLFNCFVDKFSGIPFSSFPPLILDGLLLSVPQLLAHRHVLSSSDTVDDLSPVSVLDPSSLLRPAFKDLCIRCLSMTSSSENHSLLSLFISLYSCALHSLSSSSSAFVFAHQLLDFSVTFFGQSLPPFQDASVVRRWVSLGLDQLASLPPMMSHSVLLPYILNLVGSLFHPEVRVPVGLSSISAGRSLVPLRFTSTSNASSSRDFSLSSSIPLSSQGASWLQTDPSPLSPDRRLFPSRFVPNINTVLRYFSSFSSSRS
jgi:hypothetical protein